jgi:hypothetical protein
MPVTALGLTGTLPWASLVLLALTMVLVSGTAFLLARAAYRHDDPATLTRSPRRRGGHNGDAPR